MWKTFGSRPLTVSSSTRGGSLATRRDLLSSPFKATPPTSPTAHPSMNFSAAHMQTYLPWNTAVTVTAKGSRAKLASTAMPKRPTTRVVVLLGEFGQRLDRLLAALIGAMWSNAKRKLHSYVIERLW